MNEKIKVEIYGIKDQLPPTGCSSCAGCKSAGDCAPPKTMGEMYDELVSFIDSSNVKEKVELHFIDIEKNGLENHEDVKNAIEVGNRIPFTAIGGALKFQGGVYPQMVVQEVLKALQG
jgi:hypothetical protein